jgi:hypothetical protein
LADVARGEVRAPMAPGVLDGPSPVAGAFMLTGAPGALASDFLRAREPSRRFGELRVQRAQERGDFHRPFDMARGAASQLIGGGWSPVGSRGMAMGRFVIDQEYHEVSAFTQRVSAGMTSPFVVTDSVRPPMQRTRARLEGALGWLVGGFGVGLSGGLDSREHNSIDFPLRRTGRWATPSLAVGVERRLLGRVRVGGFYRWSEPTETFVLSANPLATVLYSVQGLDEPAGIALTGPPVFVRHDRRASAIGGSLDVTLLGTVVVLSHEAGQRADDQYFQITARVRPTDAWRLDGSETRLQISRALGTRTDVMLVAHALSFDGEGRRSDLPGLAIRGSDAQQAAELDVRRRWSRWQAGVIAGVTNREYVREDFVADLAARVDVATPFVSGELARHFGATSVALGASWANRTPSGQVPNVNRGANYRRLQATELAYDAAEASAWAAWLSLQRAVKGRTVFVQLRGEQASPSTRLPSRLQPGGDRTRLAFSLGYRP